MTCHYVEETGHTLPVVGALYVRWLRYAGQGCRLKSFNEATGMASLVGRHGVQFVSLTELSRWHRVKEAA